MYTSEFQKPMREKILVLSRLRPQEATPGKKGNLPVILSFFSSLALERVRVMTTRDCEERHTAYVPMERLLKLSGWGRLHQRWARWGDGRVAGLFGKTADGRLFWRAAG